MSRTPTTTDTTVEWDERVTDPDSDSLTISLILDAVDDGTGFTNDGTDSSNLSWLSFSKQTSTLNDGTYEAIVSITAQKSGLTQGYTYRFKITADDGTTAVDRTFTLSIEKPPIYKGVRMYVAAQDNDAIYEHDLSQEFDVSSATYNRNGLVDNPDSVYIRPDGEVLYESDKLNGEIKRYSFGTAWDITTLSFVNSISSADNGPSGIYFKPDGTKFYETGTGGEKIYQWDLSTAWDLSSATNVASQATDVHFPTDVYVRENGEQLFITDSTYDYVVVYNLSTPWDLSSSSEGHNLLIDSNQQEPKGVYFAPDGKDFYVTGTSGSPISVHQYKLSTAWDISTASHLQSFDISSQTSEPVGVFLGGP